MGERGDAFPILQILIIYHSQILLANLQCTKIIDNRKRCDLHCTLFSWKFSLNDYVLFWAVTNIFIYRGFLIKIIIWQFCFNNVQIYIYPSCFLNRLWAQLICYSCTLMMQIDNLRFLLIILTFHFIVKSLISCIRYFLITLCT